MRGERPSKKMLQGGVTDFVPFFEERVPATLERREKARAEPDALESVIMAAAFGDPVTVVDSITMDGKRIPIPNETIFKLFI